MERCTEGYNLMGCFLSACDSVDPEYRREKQRKIDEHDRECDECGKNARYKKARSRPRA